jgi:hypothetical protein
MTESGEIQDSLVRQLMTPSPSLPFELKRRQEGGGVKSFPVRVRVLHPEEIHDALVDAQAYARKRGEISKDYQDLYREAQAVEVLLRAVCHPELVESADGKTRTWRRMFVNSQQLRSALFEHELAQLLNCYEVTKATYRYGPQFTEAQVDEYIEKLADDFAGPYFLGQLDSADVPELIFSLARRAMGLLVQAGWTSSGSQSSSGSESMSSETGTSGFTELPEALLTASSPPLPMPTDKLMTKEEARQFVRDQAKKPDA